MNKHQEMVREFMLATRQLVNNQPKDEIDIACSRLREALIQEEAGEFSDAIRSKDKVEIADALGDLLYVVYGAANSYGIDIEPIFAEIHRSNMTKVGGPKDPVTGKVMKPSWYTPPILADILEKQSQ